MPYLTIPTTEPFFIPGRAQKQPVGCLLVHGFTGTPKEMRWMAEYLAAQGYTILGVRLAGHATQPADMLRVHWQDWLASVEDGWNLLNGTVDQIFLMGLSMGGILSLLFASGCYTNHPVAGIVTMSTPYALGSDPRLRYIKLLSLIKPVIPKGASDWRDKEAGKTHVDYPEYPVRAIGELVKLIEEMQMSLPSVTAPALLIHGHGDTAGGGFVPDSMQQIYDHLSSQDKQMLWIEDSGHVITRDHKRQEVFEATTKFVQRVSGVAA